MNNCNEVTGIVIDQKAEYSRSGDAGTIIYYPVIRFEANNEWVTQQYSDGSNPAKFKKGEDVTVQYYVKDPKEFLIKGYS